MPTIPRTVPGLFFSTFWKARNLTHTRQPTSGAKRDHGPEWLSFSRLPSTIVYLLMRSWNAFKIVTEIDIRSAGRGTSSQMMWLCEGRKRERERERERERKLLYTDLFKACGRPSHPWGTAQQSVLWEGQAVITQPLWANSQGNYHRVLSPVWFCMVLYGSAALAGLR